MVFFHLFSTAFSSVLYGIVATIVTLVLFYVLFYALDRDVVRSKAFFAVTAVLGLLLVVQYSLLIGAASANGEVASAEIYLQQLTENSVGVLGVNDSQELLDNVTNEFPLIGTYIGFCNFAGHEVSDVATSMAEGMHDFLSTYMWHRVWWILCFLVTAIAVMFLVPGTGRKTAGGSTYEESDTSMGETNDWGM